MNYIVGTHPKSNKEGRRPRHCHFFLDKRTESPEMTGRKKFHKPLAFAFARRVFKMGGSAYLSA